MTDERIPGWDAPDYCSLADCVEKDREIQTLGDRSSSSEPLGVA